MPVSIKPMPPMYNVDIGSESYQCLAVRDDDTLVIPYQRLLARFTFLGLGDIGKNGETVSWCGDDYTIYKRKFREHNCHVHAYGANLELVAAGPNASTVLLDIRKPKNTFGNNASNSYEPHLTQVASVKQITNRLEDSNQSTLSKTSVARFYMPRARAVEINQKWHLTEGGRTWFVESVGDLNDYDRFPYVECRELGYASP